MFLTFFFWGGILTFFETFSETLSETFCFTFIQLSLHYSFILIESLCNIAVTPGQDRSMLKSKREQSPERDREQDREQVPEQVPRPSTESKQP